MALHCTAPYYIAWHCTILYGMALHGVAPYYIVLHFTALHGMLTLFFRPSLARPLPRQPTLS